MRNDRLIAVAYSIALPLTGVIVSVAAVSAAKAVGYIAHRLRGRS